MSGVFSIARLLCAFAALVATTPLLAAVQVRTFGFTATGFPSGAPYATVTGSITLSFDTASNKTNQTAGMTVNSLSMPISQSLVYSYTASSDTLTIGAYSSASTVNGNQDDMRLIIQKAFTQSVHTSSSFLYATIKDNVNKSYTASSVSVSNIPEPSSWATMILGFLMAGGAIRRARRAGTLPAIHPALAA